MKKKEFKTESKKILDMPLDSISVCCKVTFYRLLASGFFTPSTNGLAHTAEIIVIIICHHLQNPGSDSL